MIVSWGIGCDVDLVGAIEELSCFESCGEIEIDRAVVRGGVQDVGFFEGSKDDCGRVCGFEDDLFFRLDLAGVEQEGIVGVDVFGCDILGQAEDGEDSLVSRPAADAGWEQVERAGKRGDDGDSEVIWLGVGEAVIYD